MMRDTSKDFTHSEDVTVLVGDCVESMKALPDASVHCCITSPPYWGLRDYGTASWEGGDTKCEHTISMPKKYNDPKRGQKYSRPEIGHRGGDASGCFLCGAKRTDSQLGLESTPEEYVENMVLVFREVKRVLRDDGTLWLNLGDSYMGGGGNYNKTGISQAGGQHLTNVRNRKDFIRKSGVKPKDLVGIPWRVALALQADGWYLRQDIIWHKPNPMPESVTDRCTKTHEYIFLLTKNNKYYYDNEAIKEKGVIAGGTKAAKGSQERFDMNGVNSRPPEYKTYSGMRNKRSVWTVTTKPFRGAHFAVFPPDLIEPCVLAGTLAGGTVLDPFGGSGTTAAVALKHNRKAILCELNEEYARIMPKRIESISGLSNTQQTLF